MLREITQYHDKEKTKIYRHFFTDDNLTFHRKFREYHENGILAELRYYLGGVAHGVHNSYNENGIMIYTCKYYNGYKGDDMHYNDEGEKEGNSEQFYKQLHRQLSNNLLQDYIS